MERTPLVELPSVPFGDRPRTGARYLLGVDGGATKTLAAVLDLQTRCLHLGHAGPSNEDAVGARAAVQALMDAADAALVGASVGRDQLGAAVLAVAGTDTESVAAHVRASHAEDWIVVNDVVGAWATATSGVPGVGVIAGTGSNVFGVGEDGRAWRAGGWGHVLGDEGSGYWIGAHSIKAALHDRDASGPATALSDAVARFFGVATVEAAASLVYAKPLTKGEIAAFAAETARLAEQGDAVARELFADGARQLAAQVVAVIDRTGLAGEFPIGLIGSAFKAGEVFVGPLRDAVHEHAPGAAIAPVEMAPVGGSLLLAARVCGASSELPAGELAAAIDDAARA